MSNEHTINFKCSMEIDGRKLSFDGYRDYDMLIGYLQQYAEAMRIAEQWGEEADERPEPVEEPTLEENVMDALDDIVQPSDILEILRIMVKMGHNVQGIKHKQIKKILDNSQGMEVTECDDGRVLYRLWRPQETAETPNAAEMPDTQLSLTQDILEALRAIGKPADVTEILLELYKADKSPAGGKSDVRRCLDACDEVVSEWTGAVFHWHIKREWPLLKDRLIGVMKALDKGYSAAYITDVLNGWGRASDQFTLVEVLSCLDANPEFVDTWHSGAEKMIWTLAPTPAPTPQPPAVPEDSLLYKIVCAVNKLGDEATSVNVWRELGGSNDPSFASVCRVLFDTNHFDNKNVGGDYVWCVFANKDTMQGGYR